MKIIKLFITICLLLILSLFALQNLNLVSIDFYKWDIRLPLALVIIGVYILGMFTGGMLWSLLKKLTKSDNSNS